MSPLPLQNELLTRALVQSLGLKGGLTMSLDEILVPVSVVQDLTEGPHQIPQPCAAGGNQGAAGAGRFSFVAVQPGGGNILAVDKVVFHNETGATARCTVLRLAPSDIAAMTLNSRAGLVALNRNQIDAATNPRVASDVLTLDHNTSAIGSVIGFINANTGEQALYEFPFGAYLRGDDRFGAAAYGLVQNTVNTALRATFYCREFRAQ